MLFGNADIPVEGQALVKVAQEEQALQKPLSYRIPPAEPSAPAKTASQAPSVNSHVTFEDLDDLLCDLEMPRFSTTVSVSRKSVASASSLTARAGDSSSFLRHKGTRRAHE